MQSPQDVPNSNLKRLALLSRNINEAMNEIFSLAFTQAYQDSSAQAVEQGPDIKLIEKNLWINSIMIPLISRDKTLDLVQTLFCAEGLALTKEEILAAVYRAEERDSDRYREALDTRLTKLLSRTRKFLREALEPVHLPFHLDWLVYDIRTKKYRLYRIRTDLMQLH